MTDATKAPPATTTSPAATPAKGKPSPAKKWIIVGGAAVIAAVAAYGVGYFQGAHKVAELERQAAAATRSAHLLEARRRLDLADLALDQQNFGIAEAHLRAAAQKLNAAAEEGPLQNLATDVAQTRIGVTGDIVTQQQTIRGFIERFDREHPPSAEVSATPGESAQ